MRLSVVRTQHSIWFFTRLVDISYDWKEPKWHLAVSRFHQLRILSTYILARI